MHRHPLVILLFICIVLLINGYMHQRNTNPRLSANTEIPALSLTNSAGEQQIFNAATLNGQVTVINFFASWCAPCKVEMPELVKLKKSSGAHFVGIAWNAAPESITPWLKQFGNPFDSVWYDNIGESIRVLNLRGIPVTLVLDKKGIVRYQVTGAVEPSVATEKLLPLLQQLSHE